MDQVLIYYLISFISCTLFHSLQYDVFTAMNYVLGLVHGKQKVIILASGTVLVSMDEIYF